MAAGADVGVRAKMKPGLAGLVKRWERVASRESCRAMTVVAGYVARRGRVRNLTRAARAGEVDVEKDIAGLVVRGDRPARR